MKKLIKNIVESTSKLLSGDKQDDGDYQVPDGYLVAEENEEKSAPASALADIEGALTRIAKKHGNALAGRVQVMRFDKIREAMGRDWPKKRHKMEQVIRRVSMKYLSKNDLIRPYGECAHFIVFAGISQTEAEAKCALIRDEVEKAFSSDYDLAGKIEISTAVTSVEGEVKLKDVGSLEEIFDKLKKAEGKKAEKPQTQPEKEAVKEKAVKKTEAKPEKQQHEPIPTPKSAVQKKEKSAEWEAFHQEKDASGIQLDPSSIKPVSEEFWCTWELDIVDFQEIKDLLKHVQIAFQPIWDVELKKVDSFSTLPIKGTAPYLVYEDSVMNEDPKGETSLLLDLMGMELSQVFINAQKEKKRRLSTYVHYESVAAGRFRKKVVKSCSALEEDLRPQFLFELVGLPKRVIASSIVDAARAVTRFTGGVSVRCHLDWPVFTELHTAGVRRVGFSLEGLGLDEERAMDAIGAFVEKATAAGLEVYARDLPTKNHVMAAVAMGVRYVYGRPIVSTPELTGDQMKFETETLISPK